MSETMDRWNEVQSDPRWGDMGMPQRAQLALKFFDRHVAPTLKENVAPPVARHTFFSSSFPAPHVPIMEAMVSGGVDAAKKMAATPLSEVPIPRALDALGPAAR